MDNKQIGRRIWDLREDQHMSRECLAGLADLSPKFIYEVELGRKSFSAYTLLKLAKALSTTCDYIMLGEETKYNGTEKVICVLETMGPKKMSKVQDVLKLLGDLCDSI